MNKKKAIEVLEVMDKRYTTFDADEREALAMAIRTLKRGSSFYATEKFRCWAGEDELRAMHQLDQSDF